MSAWINFVVCFLYDVLYQFMSRCTNPTTASNLIIIVPTGITSLALLASFFVFYFILFFLVLYMYRTLDSPLHTRSGNKWRATPFVLIWLDCQVEVRLSPISSHQSSLCCDKRSTSKVALKFCVFVWGLVCGTALNDATTEGTSVYWQVRGCDCMVCLWLAPMSRPTRIFRSSNLNFFQNVLVVFDKPAFQACQSNKRRCCFFFSIFLLFSDFVGERGNKKRTTGPGHVIWNEKSKSMYDHIHKAVQPCISNFETICSRC